MGETRETINQKQRPLAFIFLSYWMINVTVSLITVSDALSPIFIAAKTFTGLILAFFGPHIKKYLALTFILESTIWTVWAFARRDAFSLFFFGLDHSAFIGIVILAALSTVLPFDLNPSPNIYPALMGVGVAGYFVLIFEGCLVGYGVNRLIIWLLRLRKRAGVCLTDRMFLDR